MLITESGQVTNSGANEPNSHPTQPLGQPLGQSGYRTAPDGASTTPSPPVTGGWAPIPPPPPNGGQPQWPSRAPQPAEKKSDKVATLNRATAAAVSLAVVGVVGLGTGIAVANVASSTNPLSELSDFAGGTDRDSSGAQRTNPTNPRSDDDGDSWFGGESDEGSGSSRIDPRSGGSQSDGFTLGVPGGSTHGRSGAS